MRLYSDTGNKTYIESLNIFYGSTIEHHRRDNKHAGAVDPYSF